MKIINVATYTLFALSAVILASTIYFLTSIKVVDHWTLTLPEGEIHAGDTIVIQSQYHKLRDVSGESVRYLECKNVQGTWIRYELNRATSNRAKGTGGTGITLTMRRDVADIPALCKVDVNIRYDVLPFRHVYVSNSTKEFTLLPEIKDESSSAEPQAATQRSLSQVLPKSQILDSSPHSSPIDAAVQSNNSQAVAETEQNPAPSSPSILSTITSPIINLVRGL